VADGKGCTCGAYGSCECGCDADWTPQEIYDLREAVKKLTEERDLAIKAIGDEARSRGFAEARLCRAEEVIRYALEIGTRRHGDDYAYDDCWRKMQDLLFR
jgi:hypothetical protein